MAVAAEPVGPPSAPEPVFFFAVRGSFRSAPDAFPDSGVDFHLVIETTQCAGRLMLMPVTDADGEVSDIVTAQVVTMTDQPGRTARDSWTMVGASPVPWTVAQVQMVLNQVLGPRKYFRDSLRLFPQDAVAEFGPALESVPFTGLTRSERTSIAILAHAPTPQLRQRHAAMTSRGLLDFRQLLDFGVFHDPDGKHRLLMLERMEASRKVGIHPSGILPPPGGMVAIIPADFPKQLLAPDLTLTLTKAECEDETRVLDWFAMLAQTAVSMGPVQPSFRPHLAAARREILKMGQVRIPVVLWTALRDAQAQLAAQGKALELAAADKARLEAALEAANGQRDAAKRALGEKDGALRGTLNRERELAWELERLRALDADALSAQLAEARAEAQVLGGLLEQADRELKRAPAPASALAAPVTWEQLWAAVAGLVFVEMPGDALVAAQRQLAQRHETGRWVERCWRVALALEHYAGSKAAGLRGPHFADFHAYTRQFPTEGVTERTVRARESETVDSTPRLREARVFRTAVGMVYCAASVDLGSHQRLAPHLRFYDDTEGESGRVHIGYVGLPLSTTKN